MSFQRVSKFLGKQPTNSQYIIPINEDIFGYMYGVMSSYVIIIDSYYMCVNSIHVIKKLKK